LAGFALALYLGTGRFEFLNFDDPHYVAANPVVARGLSASGLRWAFGYQAANWHPLTWLSHMLDVELFGLAPGRMHLVNAGLHALNAALCFLALDALSRAFWPSLLVAALFAAHPVRVEVVAWIAERKELLAGTCFFLLLLAHGRWARTKNAWAYGLVVLTLALGLMAKPILVTAPFVLLLLDVWPLARFTRGRALPVVLEKVPLFALAASASVLTWQAQHAGGAVGELAALSALERLWSAGAGLLAYLRVTLWPAGLAAFYPHPLILGHDVLVPGLVGLATTLLLSLAAWRLKSRVPAVFTGWFWFLGMLVPVVGLVQVGDQAWADRYAYLTTVGLYVALVFGMEEALRGRASARTALTLAGLAAAGVLALVTSRTVPHWRDDKALFERAVTEGNWLAHNNLGLVYLERREFDRARGHFEQAAQLNPRFVEARFNLALAHEGRRDFVAAVAGYRAAVEARPGHPESLARLASLARAEGQDAQALEFLEQAIRANPAHAPSWLALALLLLETGDVDRAANCAASALKLSNELPEAHALLAEIALRRGELEPAEEHLEAAQASGAEPAELAALRGRWRLQRGERAAARREFERALTLDPDSARARHDLGALLLSSGELDLARAQFQALADIRPGDPQAEMGLAAVALAKQESGEAIRLLEALVRARPEFLLAQRNLAVAYEQAREWRKALACYEIVLQALPPDPEAAAAAAWLLATCPDETLQDGQKALRWARYAFERQSSSALEILAAALARAGKFQEAAEAQQEVVARARDDERASHEKRLALFRTGQAYTRVR
jgi:tetratricopeptide (TPR) repeat protein